MTKAVLILGADGFIGRHIAFALREQGYDVTACARAPQRLARMGFKTLAVDLTDPACHQPAFWAPHLAAGVHLVNAAGLLTGSDAAFRAVHIAAPDAAMAALDGGQSVLLSAVGIEADTSFAAFRREGEAVAQRHNATILRAGLVLADSSYGGSSLLRALAVLPMVTPLIGGGQQPVNPIHAQDLAQVIADCLATPPGPGPRPNGAWEIGGPEVIRQAELIAMLRRWFGLPQTRTWAMPNQLAGAVGRLGDALRLGPISATAVAQLNHSLLADPAALLAKLPTRPRGVSQFINARPAGTQDLWQARLYLLKPLIRLTLAVMWLASGLLGLLLPVAAFSPLFAGLPLPDVSLTLLARGTGLIDLALGWALLRNIAPRAIGWAQLAMVTGYTLALSVLLPALWLAPFGELLKNLPILMLIATHIALIEER
ncbi:SDR family oxidoreductase [Pseudorhodobacter sp. E13]|uniref:SDR family oxidoreductase n=1 Tax=Pseudorhodobacter sp. E13 TaxID=2487931 RepID=UPI001315975F|nr:SDR family oxidoreductase [Pseudorhodobacter sp. E13]